MEQKKKMASILLEALPYMQQFNGKTMVIKFGGNAMETDELKLSVMKDIALLQSIGVKVVLVHGGGPAISGMLEKLGIENEFIDGLRVTNDETIDVVKAMLTGKVNKDLVVDLDRTGAKAIGLSGIDGKMVVAAQKDVRLGYVGDITHINTEAIEMALDKGYIPVIAPLGVDADGQTYNINADTAAVEIAAALNAEKFILLSNIPGVMLDVNDPESMISEMTIERAKELIEDGVINGGMIPKIQAGITAMKWGLNSMTIIDGRIDHSLIIELFSVKGIGTLITK
ncbi:MAG: acetylglutamate kinase [Lactobacillales bacterium]|nr:acetylglutamate kinase [Lactobacillales bacterium]